MSTTIKTTLVFFIVAGSIVTAGPTAAQSYPTKPIRLIVPFPPGGPSDIVARMLAQKLTETFKQSVVVDNRPGGGGTIGTETAVRANPDGYTMILVSASYAANAALYKLPYDPVNDVAPIALIGENGLVVTLHPSVPVTSIKELIAYDKANPGKLNYGSSGTGGANPPRHRTLQPDGRHQDDARAIQGRRPRTERAARRADSAPLRRHARIDPAR